MRNGNGVHWSFWVIGAVSLVWNLMGVTNFIFQLNPEAVASFPDSHRAIIESRPLWATIGFAMAVFGGAIGSVLLLMRKYLAKTVFIASMIGVIAATLHTLPIAMGSGAHFTPGELFMMIAMPLIVGAFLIWYAARAQTKGWLS